jgi:transposase InsO family protein
MLVPKKSKTELARQLNISRSALYYKPKLSGKDLKLKSKIEQVMADHKRYGHRRIAIELKINKKRARRVMRLFGLKPKRQRKWKAPPRPNDLNQAPMAIPNLIQGMIIDAQNKVWVSDSTYLPYFGKFIYLATIEDVFDRQVIGWEVSLKHSAELTARAFLNALKHRQPPEIMHSDQGSEYRDQGYLNLLKSFGVKPSMSQKASPWQNSYKESFYSGFKLELGHPECYPTLGELIEAIARQIYYYNNFRIHLALKCPPAVFAKRCEIAKTKISLTIK